MAFATAFVDSFSEVRCNVFMCFPIAVHVSLTNRLSGTPETRILCGLHALFFIKLVFGCSAQRTGK